MINVNYFHRPGGVIVADQVGTVGRTTAAPDIRLRLFLCGVSGYGITQLRMVPIVMALDVAGVVGSARCQRQRAEPTTETRKRQRCRLASPTSNKNGASHSAVAEQVHYYSFKKNYNSSSSCIIYLFKATKL